MNDLKKLQEIIDNSDNIVFFGGAGVSTDSGIKDFRGKNGLYTEKQKSNMLPEYLLSAACLHQEPELFFDYYKTKMNASDALPNVTHKYLVKLEEKGKLKAIVTQNIDGLHQKAGSKNVLELHGTTYECYCMECGKEYSRNYIFDSKGIPKCECGGIVRPKVVLYGEMLPEAFDVAAYYISYADVLIVAGTSLTVEPASGLLNLYQGKHLIIINDTPTPYDGIAEVVIRKPLKEVFSFLESML